MSEPQKPSVRYVKLVGYMFGAPVYVDHDIPDAVTRMFSLVAGRMVGAVQIGTELGQGEFCSSPECKCCSRPGPHYCPRCWVECHPGYAPPCCTAMACSEHWDSEPR